MKTYLESLLPKIASYSEKLDKLTLLIDEPWVVTSTEVFTKFIFRKDNNLLISENGNVIIGSWDLLNKANSILIQYNGNSKLYNHGFLDDAILILKLDGNTDYFVLVNQNKIPSLKFEDYFEKKYFQNENPKNIETRFNEFEIYEAPQYDKKLIGEESSFIGKNFQIYSVSFLDGIVGKVFSNSEESYFKETDTFWSRCFHSYKSIEDCIQALHYYKINKEILKKGFLHTLT